MPRIVYVGKPSDRYGKTLWEIVGNLKNFGVGRLITRQEYERFPEPCFEKIIHVDAEEIRETAKRKYERRVYAWVERVFRGRRYPRPIDLCTASYKPNFRLVPKDEEEEFYKRLAEYSFKEKIYDPYVSLPPLLNLIRREEKKAKGEPVEDVIKVPVLLKNKISSVSRVAREGETPTHYFTMGFGTPATPSLYENIEVCRPLFENRDPYKDREARTLRAVDRRKSK